MQSCTLKSFYQFSRIPMIKFLGPRHLLPKKIQSKTDSREINNVSSVAKTSGMGIIIPSIKSPFLTDFEIDIVNSGGFIDGSYQKVKPINLK